jgi:heptaprenylglyceryl phosphate synthase
VFEFDRYLPLLDPDAFSDVAFYKELFRIGYRQVLLGGTGAGDLRDVARAVRTESGLKVVLYPAGPDSVTEHVDVVVLPDVMNSNSHYSRPFGTGTVATAMNIATRGIPYVPVAYFILGNSTARWYFDAFLVPQHKLIVAYATYARMVGYRHLALDYEDPLLDIDPKLISMLKKIDGLDLLISDEFSPARAREALELGARTVITPSDVYEEAADPLALAAEFHAKLLRDP